MNEHVFSLAHNVISAGVIRTTSNSSQKNSRYSSTKLLTHLHAILFVFLCVYLVPAPAQAGIGKWLRTEAIPTVTGKRPLKIDPNRITVTSGGKKVLEYEGDSLYVRAGDLKFQTSQLRKRISQAGAVFSGDMAVLSQVAAEQLKKELEKGVQDGLIEMSEVPPVESVEVPADLKHKPVQVVIGRQITIYNQTPISVRYVLNKETFELPTGEGFKHSSSTGEFFVQFDKTLDNTVVVARYYLTGSTYGFIFDAQADNVTMTKH